MPTDKLVALTRGAEIPVPKEAISPMIKVYKLVKIVVFREKTVE